MSKNALAYLFVFMLLGVFVTLNMNGISPAVFIFILVFLGFYFIPSMVASRRQHLSAPAIFAFNLLLGWTFLGWALALVWALTSNTRANAERFARAPPAA